MISVIVPVYNVEKYLDRCIESLLGQTYKNIEIILIDDGSTDDSGRICDQWKEKDSRIRVFHQKNKGIAAVRNAGLGLAQGDYIAWVDSDDYVDSTFLEKMHMKLQEKGIDMVMCSFYTDTDGEIVHTGKRLFHNEVIDKQSFLERLYTYGLYSVVWNKLVKKDKYEEVQFPCGRLFEDSSVMCQVLSKCNNVAIIGTPLYYYKRHKDAITVQKLDETKCLKYVNDYYMWLKHDIALHREANNEKLVALASRHLCDKIIHYCAEIHKSKQGQWKKIYKEYVKEVFSYKEFSIKTKMKYLVGKINFSLCYKITKR